MASSSDKSAPKQDIFKFSKDNMNVFAQIISHLRDEVMLVDALGCIVFVNEVAVCGLGHTKKNILNKCITHFMEEKMSVLAWKKTFLRKLKRKNAPMSYTFHRLPKSGEMQILKTTASCMLFDGQLYVLMVSRDITREIEYQDKIKKSERLEAVQNVIVGMSREIRHPLRGLWDSSQSLIAKYSDRDFEYIGYKEFKDIMRILTRMRDQTRYCLDTTDRLLGFYKKEHGFEESFCSTNDIIQEVTKMIKYQMDISDIQMQLKLISKLPQSAIPAYELNQVINNVLTNALQSISSNGRIDLKTKYKKDQNMIQIECRDNGVGMSKETLARIFDPFFTTKHHGLEKSSGLGLSIVYFIVKSFRGKIKITSNFGEGTSVKILLPVYRNKDFFT